MSDSPFPPMPSGATAANCHHGTWDSDKLVCRCDAGWYTDPSQDILSGNFSYCATAGSAGSGSRSAANIVPGPAHAKKLNINSAVVVLIIVGVLLLVAGVVVCYRCCCRRRRRSGRHYRRSTEVVYSEAPHNAERILHALTDALHIPQQQPQPQPHQQPQQQQLVLTPAVQPPAVVTRRALPPPLLLPPPSSAQTRLPRSLPLQPLHPQTGSMYYEGNYLPQPADAAPLDMTYSSGGHNTHALPPRTQVRSNNNNTSSAMYPPRRSQRILVSRSNGRVRSREPVDFATGLQEREPTYVVTLTPPLAIKSTRPARSACSQG